MKKENTRNFILFILTIMLLTTATVISLYIKSITTLGLTITFTLTIISMIFWFTLYFIKLGRLRVETNSSFNMLTNRALSFGRVGILTFSSSTHIITSVSPLLEDLKFNSLIGKTLSEFNPDLKNLTSVKDLTINRNGKYYELRIFGTLNAILIKDVTSMKTIYNSFSNNQSAILMIKINYYNTSSQNTENDRLRINNLVANYLTTWSTKNNAFLKLSTSSEAHIVFMNKIKFLKSFSNGQSPMLNEIKEELFKENLKAIISIGISYGNAENHVLGSFAQEALETAENRGGDQIVIKEYGSETKFQSGLNEVSQPSSKVPVKTFLDFMKKEIIEADNIIISGHYFADFDAVSGMVGIDHISSLILKLNNRNVPIHMLVDSTEETANKIFQDTITPKQKDNLLNIDKAIKLLTAKTLLIVVDTSSVKQTPMGKVIESTAKKKNIIIIDHHRVSEDKIKTLNNNYEYIDVAASSTAEIIADMMSIMPEFNAKTMPNKLSNLLLTGIYLDTKQLTRKTSHKTLSASSWLTSQGASTSIAHNWLKIDLQYSKYITEISKNAEIFNHNVAISQTDLNHSNINTIISLAAEHLCEIKGIEASFVIGKLGHKKFRVSARSNETYNVQIIAELMGGGGHFNASAFVKENIECEDLIKELKFNIETLLKKKK